MTIATNKEIGRDTYIEIQPNSSGAFFEIGAESRGFSVDDKADELDVTTRGSTAKEYEAGFSEINADIDGLFNVGASTPFWEYLTKGAVGTIKWYPEGKATGKPMRTSTYKVLSRKEDTPYDGVTSGAINMRLTSEIAYGTAA